MKRESDYPFDTRHPDATPGILPPETRAILLRDGWIHESEVDAISNTRHTGRRRWNVASALIGNERYYRLDDILAKLSDSYQSAHKSLKERAEAELRADKAAR